MKELVNGKWRQLPEYEYKWKGDLTWEDLLHVEHLKKEAYKKGAWETFFVVLLVIAGIVIGFLTWIDPL